MAARNGSGAAAVHFRPKLVQFGAVPAELRRLREGVLQAGEVGGQGRRSRGGERIDAPRAALRARHEAVAAEISQVPRDFRLGQPQHRLEMTDAQRPLRQQMDQAQAGDIAQAVVEAEQLHRAGTMQSKVERLALKTLSPQRKSFNALGATRSTWFAEMFRGEKFNCIATYLFGRAHRT